ncbi:MAG: hypothetical protein ACLR23_16630 [Clostridia bacterium]
MNIEQTEDGLRIAGRPNGDIPEVRRRAGMITALPWPWRSWR